MRVTVDPSSSVPPYEQLRGQIAAQASEGVLPSGTRLPTVRALAQELGIAVNTVARAYRELEADGVVRTAGRKGTVIAPSADAVPGTRETAAGFVGEMRRQGLTLPEAQLLIEELWPIRT